MSKKYVNEPNLQTAMTEYNKNLTKGREVFNQYGYKEGYVTQVYDNTKGAGEQVYAVVADPDQDPAKVQEVTVLFRGSTGPDKVLSNPADVWNDWVENDALLAIRIWAQEHPNTSKDHDRSTSQLRASSEALNKIMKTYPNAKVKAYGHSLGSMDAQYALANLSDKDIKRIESAYIYNGPNIYGLLDKSQQKRVDSIKGRIVNYADPKDSISMVGREIEKGSEGSVGMVHFADSKDIGFVDQHMTYGYRLDKNGQIKVLTSAQTQILYQAMSSMQAYYSIKDSLTATGGGLNRQETFFLDSEQARVIASSLTSAAQTAQESIQSHRNEAVEKAENLYNAIESMFEFIWLSSEEIKETFAEAGVDYQTIVGNVTTALDSKVDAVAKLTQDFTNLEASIKSGVEEIVAKDSELAGQIASWSQGQF